MTDLSAESALDAERGNIFNELLQCINERYGEQDVPPDVAPLVNLCRREAKRWTSTNKPAPDAKHGDGSGPSEVTKDPNENQQKKRKYYYNSDHQLKRKKQEEKLPERKNNLLEIKALNQYTIINKTLANLHKQMKKYKSLKGSQLKDNNLLKFKKTEKGYKAEFNKIKQRLAQEEKEIDKNKFEEELKQQKEKYHKVKKVMDECLEKLHNEFIQVQSDVEKLDNYFETEKIKIEMKIQEQKEKYFKKKILMDECFETLNKELAQAERDYDIQKLLNEFQTKKLKIEEEIQKHKEKYDNEKKLTEEHLEKLKIELTQVQSDEENKIKKLYNQLSAAKIQVKQHIVEMKQAAHVKEKELIMKIQEVQTEVIKNNEKFTRIEFEMKKKIHRKLKSLKKKEIQEVQNVKKRIEQLQNTYEGKIMEFENNMQKLKNEENLLKFKIDNGMLLLKESESIKRAEAWKIMEGLGNELAKIKKELNNCLAAQDIDIIKIYKEIEIQVIRAMVKKMNELADQQADKQDRFNIERMHREVQEKDKQINKKIERLNEMSFKQSDEKVEQMLKKQPMQILQQVELEQDEYKKMLSIEAETNTNIDVNMKVFEDPLIKLSDEIKKNKDTSTKVETKRQNEVQKAFEIGNKSQKSKNIKKIEQMRLKSDKKKCCKLRKQRDREIQTLKNIAKQKKQELEKISKTLEDELTVLKVPLDKLTKTMNKQGAIKNREVQTQIESMRKYKAQKKDIHNKNMNVTLLTSLDDPKEQFQMEIGGKLQNVSDKTFEFNGNIAPVQQNDETNKLNSSSTVFVDTKTEQ